MVIPASGAFPMLGAAHPHVSRVSRLKKAGSFPHYEPEGAGKQHKEPVTSHMPCSPAAKRVSFCAASILYPKTTLEATTKALWSCGPNDFCMSRAGHAILELLGLHVRPLVRSVTYGAIGTGSEFRAVGAALA